MRVGYNSGEEKQISAHKRGIHPNSITSTSAQVCEKTHITGSHFRIHLPQDSMRIWKEFKLL